MNFDPASLKKAEHVNEPVQVQLGWSAKDVDESELVDDDHIAADPDSQMAEDVDPDHELWPDLTDDDVLAGGVDR